MPLAYRIEAGAHPWTGRLRAIAFRTARFDAAGRPVLDAWEAGALLDKRDPETRALYVGNASGTELSPLRWQSLDDNTRAALNAIGNEPGLGPRRLSWLRGVMSNTALRRRDTRLGSGGGARVLVMPPPRWLPMRAGHAAFHARHANRPTTVWLGTRDGLLHGFNATTGEELAGYLPRAMLARAAALADPTTAIPVAPCPRPEIVDADPGGEWRTLLLCGIPAASPWPDEDAPDARAAAFVLDVSGMTIPAPIKLAWEVSASNALPLAGTGPLRAAAIIDHGVRRWFAVAILQGTEHTAPGLALLPLDSPTPAAWADGRGARRLWLPASGCHGNAPARLLAATVLADADGIATAAYVTDSAGGLWRFALAPTAGGTAPGPATCLYRQQSRSGHGMEAPVIVHGTTGPLVVYGDGGQITAVPDRTRTDGSAHGARGTPRQIDVLPQGDGVTLRASPGQRAGSGDGESAGESSGNSGWTLALPHPGELVDQLLPASPVHLVFTTRTPDGRQRSYLVDATTGESAAADAQARQPGGGLLPAITGLPSEDGDNPPAMTIEPVAIDPATAPGASRRDIHELSLWTLNGDTAHVLQHARFARRRGRLGWRELIRTPL